MLKHLKRTVSASPGNGWRRSLQERAALEALLDFNATRPASAGAYAEVPSIGVEHWQGEGRWALVAGSGGGEGGLVGGAGPWRIVNASARRLHKKQ